MGSKSKLVFETLESDPDGIIDASQQILNVQGTQFPSFAVKEALTERKMNIVYEGVDTSDNNTKNCKYYI